MRHAVVVIAALMAGGFVAAGAQAPPSQSLELSPAHVERLRHYHDVIGTTARTLNASSTLAEMLRPVLASAAERSVDHDARAENQAAILAVAFYTNGRRMAALIPSAREWPQARPLRLLLRNRHDLAQHFMVSAALAAAAGQPLADALGLYKEMDDARRGTGFSFADLAADRSGTRFGHLSTRSTESALQLQSVVAAALDDRHMMPDPWNLPEGLDEAAFARRFRNTRSSEYRSMLDDIDRQIAALPLFRAFGGQDD